MLEDDERRTIAIAITASKFTGQTLAKAFQAVLQQMQQMQREAQTPQGRQSVNKLMNHGASTSTIPIDGNTRLFDRIALKHNVDYAFHKTGPKQYLLFFKSSQADAVTHCLADYTKQTMKKSRKPSIKKGMERLAEDITRKKPREREHRREVAHDDR